MSSMNDCISLKVLRVVQKKVEIETFDDGKYDKCQRIIRNQVSLFRATSQLPPEELNLKM